MIRTDTIRYGLYVAAAVAILTLSGIFETFDGREVVAGLIDLSMVLLIFVLIGTGYLTASRARSERSLTTLSNGAVGSLLVGLVLLALILLQVGVATAFPDFELAFVFPNFAPLVGSAVTFGVAQVSGGMAALLSASVLFGLLGGALRLLSAHWRRVISLSLGLTVMIGLLESQVNRVISLPDALTLVATFAFGYIVALRLNVMQTWQRLGAGLAVGGAVGGVLALVTAFGGAADGGLLYGAGTAPQQIVALGPITVVVIYALVGALGGMVTGASGTIHNGAVALALSVLLLGVLNWQAAMTPLAALITLLVVSAVAWYLPELAEPADQHYDTLRPAEQRGIQRVAFFALLGVLVVAPFFMGQYITNVVNLVGLYIIMGLGLNITVGYAGLLDLGYVSFFAIGAYTLGILTTPSPITCGMQVGFETHNLPVVETFSPALNTTDSRFVWHLPDARELPQEEVAAMCAQPRFYTEPGTGLIEMATGVRTFWQAWPLAIGVSALAGLLLGIPILRLRGDYLAIVTLGFGQIIGILVKANDFKPLTGAAQGIPAVPRPVLDLSAIVPGWRFELNGEIGIYYLILTGVLLTALIAYRLAVTRPGRAWRAMRSDEMVAQASGVNIVGAKLLAFAFGASFAGLAGALSGTRLFGVYPDSFTLFVSINVLSLVIIGGLGSIPGVMIGAFVLIGLPEVLRELDAFRLLAFGALLVATMLLKPDGLLPPRVRELAGLVHERHERDDAAVTDVEPGKRPPDTQQDEPRRQEGVVS